MQLGARKGTWGTVVKTFPRKGNSRAIYRISCRVRWQDGTITLPRASWLVRKRYGWLQIVHERHRFLHVAT